MPTFTNPTLDEYVVPSLQNEDGSTVVVAPGDNVTPEDDEFLGWPKVQSNAAKDAKKVAAKAAKTTAADEAATASDEGATS